MKLKSILLTIAASAVAFSSIATFSQQNFAQNRKVVFFCGKSRTGILTTYADTPDGKTTPIISWEKTWSNEYDPKEVCGIVSEKFNDAARDDALTFPILK